MELEANAVHVCEAISADGRAEMLLDWKWTLAVVLVQMGGQYFFNTIQTGGDVVFLFHAAAIRTLR